MPTDCFHCGAPTPEGCVTHDGRAWCGCNYPKDTMPPTNTLSNEERARKIVGDHIVAFCGAPSLSGHKALKGDALFESIVEALRAVEAETVQRCKKVANDHWAAWSVTEAKAACVNIALEIASLSPAQRDEPTNTTQKHQ